MTTTRPTPAPTHPYTHVQMNWETISTTALPPGWRMVYAYDDGTLSEEPCYLLLTQRFLGSRTYTDGQLTHSRPADPEVGDSRVVPADRDGFDDHFDPAETVSNYTGVLLAPGESLNDAVREYLAARSNPTHG